MTTTDRHLQTFARQQLGHVPIESTEYYIRADTTAAFEYAESGTITVIDATRPDDEVTP
ncbi:hypothetical protein ACWGPD_21645 [Streptomyces hirsutus]|uniref:hypothetical protein n=1 Tax=Streptomyces hirsutus TaxID=35620 RepID=UPI00363535A5